MQENDLQDIKDYLQKLQIYCVHLVQANDYQDYINERILNIPCQIQKLISEIDYLKQFYLEGENE